MKEKELIKKIKQLKKIEPNKEWVLLAKQEILSHGAVRDERKLEWLFTPVKRPVLVFAFRGAMVAMVLLVGLFFHMYYLSSHIPQLSLSNISSNTQNQVLNNSLDKIQDNLKKINLSLEKLKESKNSREILTMSGIIKATVNESKKMVEKIKKGPISKKISASLGEIDTSLEDIDKTSSALQDQVIERELNDLKTRTLSKENEERLEKAIEYYRQGNRSGAMILIMKITER